MEQGEIAAEQARVVHCCMKWCLGQLGKSGWVQVTEPWCDRKMVVLVVKNPKLDDLFPSKSVLFGVCCFSATLEEEGLDRIDEMCSSLSV